MASVKCFLLLIVVGVLIHESIAWNNRLPGDRYANTDPKVRDAMESIGDKLKEHDAKTLWQNGGASIRKNEVRYNFDNGAQASFGEDGFGYKTGDGNKLSFNPKDKEVKYRSKNGAEAYGKLKDDGWETGIKWDF